MYVRVTAGSAYAYDSFSLSCWVQLCGVHPPHLPSLGIGYDELNQRILVSEVLFYLRPPHKGAAVRLDKSLHRLPSKESIGL